jgi:hypothetical protein
VANEPADVLPDRSTFNASYDEHAHLTPVADGRRRGPPCRAVSGLKPGTTTVRVQYVHAGKTVYTSQTAPVLVR